MFEAASAELIEAVKRYQEAPKRLPWESPDRGVRDLFEGLKAEKDRIREELERRCGGAA